MSPKQSTLEKEYFFNVVQSNNLEPLHSGKTMANVFSSFIIKLKILLSQTHPLNIDSLLEVKNKWENLGMDEGMGKCLEEVIKNFPNEPSWVMKNAQMVLKGDDGKVLSFTSGKKEWKINVSAGDYKFRVKAPSKSAFLARLRSRKQPLSIGYLKKVEEDLKTFGPLTPAENSCFEMVHQRFSKKPSEIQNNAQIKFIFDMNGENVEYVFISGNGDYKMDVTHSNGQPQYRELHVNSDNKLKDFSCSLQTLDVDNSEDIKSQLAQRHLLTDSLKSYFNHLVVDILPKYSELIEENFQIYFTCNEQGLSVNSKSEDWKIIIQSKDGTVDVDFILRTWKLFSKQNKGKTHELTVQKLEEMRKKVRNLKDLPKFVHDILNKAIEVFCEETSYLQKNAHLIIQCDQGELEFISGKGKNKIDVFCLDDIIHWNKSSTWLAITLRFILSLPKYIPRILETVVRALPVVL